MTTKAQDNTDSSTLNQDANYDYNYGNADSNKIESEETINVVVVIDKSGSVNQYAKDLEQSYNEFIERMQKSHAADKILVETILFNEKVQIMSGFRPIKDITPINIQKEIGGTTALYDACKVGLKNALDYRNDLENAGINCKTLMFVITDGEDNESASSSASDVKQMIADLLTEERNFFSFEAILFGVGEQANFEKAQLEMGIKHLAKVGTTADEIRKMINFISSSVTSVSTGGTFSAPAF